MLGTLAAARIRLGKSRTRPAPPRSYSRLETTTSEVTIVSSFSLTKTLKRIAQQAARQTVRRAALVAAPTTAFSAGARGGSVRKMARIGLLVAAAAWAAPALAADPVDGLNVTLTGQFTSISGSCDPDGTSTITFRVAGTAVGTYPGTFVETGTVTIGPLAEFPQIDLWHAGPVTSFDAHFTIDSPAGQVEGTKHQILTRFGPGMYDTFGFCETFTSAPYFFGSVISGEFYNVCLCGPPLTLAYEAIIQRPDGRFRDAGSSGGLFGYTRTELVSGTFNRQQENIFQELLFSSAGAFPELEPPATVALTPAAAVNDVGESHTVTASVADASGRPSPDVTVEFTVNDEAAGSCSTDADGRCSIAYPGPMFPRSDVIVACADADADGVRDPAEPCGTATKEFVLPASTTGSASGGGQILAAPQAGVTFALDADARFGRCRIVDRLLSEKLSCLDVLAYVQSGNQATFYGNAVSDGVATLYRIDVVDGGEPGSSDTFEIRTSSGYSTSGVVVDGNIQVRS